MTRVRTHTHGRNRGKRYPIPGDKDNVDMTDWLMAHPEAQESVMREMKPFPTVCPNCGDMMDRHFNSGVCGVCNRRCSRIHVRHHSGAGESEYSPKARSFIGRKVKYLTEKEGKTQEQAVAQAINMAREARYKVPERPVSGDYGGY